MVTSSSSSFSSFFKFHKSALMFAAEEGHWEVVKVLMNAGANVNSNFPVSLECVFNCCLISLLSIRMIGMCLQKTEWKNCLDFISYEW